MFSFNKKACHQGAEDFYFLKRHYFISLHLITNFSEPFEESDFTLRDVIDLMNDIFGVETVDRGTKVRVSCSRTNILSLIN